MFSPADLDALLAALRAAGLRIGVEESLRAGYLLHHLGVSSDSAALRESLLALLVKSVEAREPFDRAFDAWADELASRRAAEPGLRSPAVSPQGPPSSARRPLALPIGRRRPSLIKWLKEHSRSLAIALLAVVLLGIGLYATVRRMQPPAITPDAGTAPAPSPLAPQTVPQPVRRLVPEINWNPPPWPRVLFHGLGFALLGTALGAFLWVRLRRRRYLPPAAPLPTRPGARSILPTLPPPPSGWPLRHLDVRAQEALVWGIGRFVSEQPTRRLDALRTVAATVAAGGRPELRFHSARHQREVWLWTDEAAVGSDLDYGPSLRRLEEELSVTLRRAGLPIERALFWGLPDRLTRLLESGEPSEAFAPSEVDERRDAALVVLFTDGRLLADALASERDRGEAEALLRQLSHWPALAFCDASLGAFSLAALLSRFELTVVYPDQVVRFLNGTPLGMPAPMPDALEGDLRLWAAACALAPFPLDEETVFWVRDELQLAVPAWSVRALTGSATAIGGRLTWSVAERARLLSWLLAAEPIGRVLGLWRERLADEAARRGAADSTTPWYNTPAEQHLYMQQALLDLWDRPEAAARALYALHQGELEQEIRARLAEFAPQECVGARDRVILPWRLSRLPRLTQQLLLEMDLSGGLLTYTVARAERPGRLLLAWAGCVGLALAGTMAAGLGLRERLRPHGLPTVAQVNVPRDAKYDIHAFSPDEYDISVWSAAFPRTVKRVPAGARVLISWEVEEQDPPDGGAPADLGSDLSPDLASPADLSPPLDLLPRPDMLPPWSCTPKQYTEPNSGAVFVRVCAGEFEMGSQEGDKDAADDEKWPHRVRLDEFWIGKHEISNAQYKRLKPAHKSTFDGDNLPVQEVNWDEAREYCQLLGGQLPTEAEWEYAARGPEGRKYPWGKAAPQPGRATFNRSWSDGPEAIDANPRGRGPFGTLNQAGSVWEWVADCYQDDIYKKRKLQSDKAGGVPVSNPIAVEKPDCWHVLRGGAFNGEPRDLRAAGRSAGVPGVLNQPWGFRCVRGSRRQP